MTSLWSTKKKDLIYLKAVELSQGANKVPDEVCGCVTAGGGSPQYPFSILPLTSPLHVKQNRILLRDSYSIDICRKAASKHLVSSKHYLSGIFCWASWKEMFLLLFLRYNPDYVFYRVMDTSHKLGPVLASFCSILLQFIPLISRPIPVVSAKIPSRPVRDPLFWNKDGEHSNETPPPMSQDTALLKSSDVHGHVLSTTESLSSRSLVSTQSLHLKAAISQNTAYRSWPGSAPLCYLTGICLET